MKILAVALLVACSSPPEPPAPPPARADDTPTADAGVATARWLAGDLHMHVAPPDLDDVTASITLAWIGVARLFIDGRDLGEHDGGFVHDTGGGLHTYRIEHGRSRSGFIYANLDR